MYPASSSSMPGGHVVWDDTDSSGSTLNSKDSGPRWGFEKSKRQLKENLMREEGVLLKTQNSSTSSSTLGVRSDKSSDTYQATGGRADASTSSGLGPLEIRRLNYTSDTESSVPDEEQELILASEDDEELLLKVPKDKNNEPTSIGSIKHESGKCSPCAFFQRPKGCMNGIRCPFCHLEHKIEKPKKATRPCKGQRRQFRKLWDRLTSQVDADPINFNHEAVDLPPSIKGDDKKKAKLEARLLSYRQQIVASAISKGPIPL